jgi:hypothetical protein
MRAATALPPILGRSPGESGPFRRPDVPADELAIVALLVSYPALAKFATADVVDRLGHPGLAAIGRALVQVVRDRPRSKTDRAVAMALQDASRALRLAVCEASLRLGEILNPHGDLAALVDRLGACDRCARRGWRIAIVTDRGRVCLPCLRRPRFVSTRPGMSSSVSPGGGAA